MAQNMWTRRDVLRVTGLTEREMKYLRETYEKTTGKKNRDGRDKYGNPFYKSDSYRFSGTIIRPESAHPGYIYSDEDVAKIKQIALYKQLDLSDIDIAKMIDDDNYDWLNALDDQIEALRTKKTDLEKKLIAAEYSRHMSRFVMSKLPEISLIDKNADEFTDSLKKEFINKEKLETLIDLVFEADNEANGNKMKSLYDSVSELSQDEFKEAISDRERVKQWIAMAFAFVFPDSRPEDMLLFYRILCDLGGFSTLLDAIFISIGGKEIIAEALEDYYYVAPETPRKQHVWTGESFKAKCKQFLKENENQIIEDKRKIELLELEIEECEESASKYRLMLERFSDEEFEEFANDMNQKEEHDDKKRKEE